MPTAVFKCGPTLVGLPKRHPLIERGRGVRLARQDAVKALLQGQHTKRLLAGELSAQSGHLLGRHGLGRCAAPPFARPLCAVLFGLPVLRQDALAGHGDDCGAS